MSQNIRLKRSAVPGRVPTTDQLELGEIALNTYDGKLYLKLYVLEPLTWLKLKLIFLSYLPLYLPFLKFKHL